MSVAVALTLCDSPFGFTVSYTESRAPPACYHEAVKSKLAAMKALPSETDFIVVGAGIAGLRASVELASAGRVLCLAKREVTESNTQYAQGGIAAALSDDDEVRLHLEDTLKRTRNRKGIRRAVVRPHHVAGNRKVTGRGCDRRLQRRGGSKRSRRRCRGLEGGWST